MKFYIYTNKQTDEGLTELSYIVGKLFPNALVEVGRGKPSKYKQDKLDEEKAMTVKAEDVLGKTRRDTAIKFIETVGVGVSEKTLAGV